MKTKTPEKIYLYPYSTYGIYEVETKPLEGTVEYARTDAFIEKATAWLSNVSLEDMTYKYNDFDTSEGWYKFIGDFRKYMSL